MARSNADALARRLREPDGGYAYRAYRCVEVQPRTARGCEQGDVRVAVDHTRDTSAQAWIQHLDTVLGVAETPPEPQPAEPTMSE